METEDKSCFMSIDLTDIKGLTQTHITVEKQDIKTIQPILRKGSKSLEFPATIGPLFNLIDCVQESTCEVQEQETVSETPLTLVDQGDIFIKEWELEYVNYVEFLIDKSHVDRNKSNNPTSFIDNECVLSLLFFNMRDGQIKASNVNLNSLMTHRSLKVKPSNLILKEGGLAVLNSTKALIKS